MKKVYLFLSCLLSVLMVYADEPTCKTTVAMTLNTEQWVAVKEATVTVLVKLSSAPDQMDANQAKRQALLEKLYAAKPWHVDSEQRHSADTGIVTITTEASNTVPLAKINVISQTLAAMPTSGIKITLKQVDYTPDQQATYEVIQQLRQNIYTLSLIHI